MAFGEDAEPTIVLGVRRHHVAVRTGPCRTGTVVELEQASAGQLGALVRCSPRAPQRIKASRPTARP